MPSRYQLTPEIEKRILAGIRQGAYAYIAAEAQGIPRRVFKSWFASRRRPIRDFVDRVREALAQARLRAEMAAAEKDPRFWLRHGPGRERLGSPGWSAPVKASVRRKQQETNLLLTKEWKEMWAVLSRGLSAHPEIRESILQAVREKKVRD